MRTPLFVLLISIFVAPLSLLPRPLPAQPLAGIEASPPQSAAVEQLQAGKQYPGGSRIHLPYAGINITVPKQWIGIMPVGETAFIMRSTRIKGQLKIIALPADARAMTKIMDDTLTLENDIQLIPVGPSQKKNGTISNQYYVTNSYEPFKASIIGLPATTTQTGSGFIGLGPMQDQSVYQDLIKRLAMQSSPAKP